MIKMFLMFTMCLRSAFNLLLSFLCFKKTDKKIDYIVVAYTLVNAFIAFGMAVMLWKI